MYKYSTVDRNEGLILRFSDLKSRPLLFSVAAGETLLHHPSLEGNECGGNTFVGGLRIDLQYAGTFRLVRSAFLASVEDIIMAEALPNSIFGRIQ